MKKFLVPMTAVLIALGSSPSLGWSHVSGSITSIDPNAHQIMLVNNAVGAEDPPVTREQFLLTRDREIAEAGMGYLASPAVLDAYAFLPDVLSAEEELRNEPVHVTIVGSKDDPRSVALYAAALRYPLAYKRAEWWDKREGPLANADVDYPDYPDGPAAFACTRNYCSLPVTDPAAIPAQLDRLQRALGR